MAGIDLFEKLGVSPDEIAAIKKPATGGASASAQMQALAGMGPQVGGQLQPQPAGRDLLADFSPDEIAAVKGIPPAATAVPEEDSWGTVGRKLVENIGPAFQRAAGGLMQQAGESPGLPIADLSTASNPDIREQAERAAAERAARAQVLSTAGARVAEDAAAAMEANAPAVEQWSAKGIAYNVGMAGAQMAPAIAASILTRSPVPGAAIMGGQVYGDRYAESRKEGRTPEESAQDAVAYAAAEGATEMLPLGVVLKGGKGLVSRVLRGAVAEGVQEAATEALQTSYDAGVLGDDITIGEALEKVGYSAVIGAGVGVGMGAVTHPFVRNAQDPADATVEQSPETMAANAARAEAMGADRAAWGGDEAPGAAPPGTPQPAPWSPDTDPYQPGTAGLLRLQGMDAPVEAVLADVVEAEDPDTGDMVAMGVWVDAAGQPLHEGPVDAVEWGPVGTAAVMEDGQGGEQSSEAGQWQPLHDEDSGAVIGWFDPASGEVALGEQPPPAAAPVQVQPEAAPADLSPAPRPDDIDAAWTAFMQPRQQQRVQAVEENRRASEQAAVDQAWRQMMRRKDMQALQQGTELPAGETPLFVTTDGEAAPSTDAAAVRRLLADTAVGEAVVPRALRAAGVTERNAQLEALGVLVEAGYLARDGKRFVRTEKAVPPAPAPQLALPPPPIYLPDRSNEAPEPSAAAVAAPPVQVEQQQEELPTSIINPDANPLDSRLPPRTGADGRVYGLGGEKATPRPPRRRAVLAQHLDETGVTHSVVANRSGNAFWYQAVRNDEILDLVRTTSKATADRWRAALREAVEKGDGPPSDAVEWAGATLPHEEAADDPSVRLPAADGLRDRPRRDEDRAGARRGATDARGTGDGKAAPGDADAGAPAPVPDAGGHSAPSARPRAVARIEVGGSSLDLTFADQEHADLARLGADLLAGRRGDRRKRRQLSQHFRHWAENLDGTGGLDALAQDYAEELHDQHRDTGVGNAHMVVDADRKAEYLASHILNSPGHYLKATDAFDKKRPTVERAIRRAWRAMGLPAENLVLRDEVVYDGADDAVTRSGGTATGRPVKVAGMTDPVLGIATIALSGSDPVSTTWHEGWHVLRAGMGFTAGELTALRADLPKLKEMAAGYLGRPVDDPAIQALDQEEAEAYAFEAYREKRAAGRGIAGVTRKLFETIRRFAHRLRGYLEGMGFVRVADVASVEQVFGRASSGRVAARERGTAARARAEEAVADAQVVAQRARARLAVDRDTGQTFVVGPEGNINLGDVTQEVSQASAGEYPAAPIRLVDGTPETVGLQHIAAKKAERIRAAGYTNEVAFVADVASNYSEVWRQSDGALLIVKERDQHHDVAAIELRLADDGSYYSVRTAFPVRRAKKYPPSGKRVLLWSAAHSADTAAGRAAPFLPPPADMSGQVADGGASQSTKKDSSSKTATQDGQAEGGSERLSMGKPRRRPNTWQRLFDAAVGGKRAGAIDVAAWVDASGLDLDAMFGHDGPLVRRDLDRLSREMPDADLSQVVEAARREYDANQAALMRRHGISNQARLEIALSALGVTTDDLAKLYQEARAIPEGTAASTVAGGASGSDGRHARPRSEGRDAGVVEQGEAVPPTRSRPSADRGSDARDPQGADRRLTDAATTTDSPAPTSGASSLKGKLSPRLKIDLRTADVAQREEAFQVGLGIGQPIDQMIRLPFQLIGGVDEQGRWRPGKAAAEAMGRVITDARFPATSSFRFLNPVMDSVRAGIIDRWGLEGSYVERDRQRDLDERRIMAQAAEILGSLKDRQFGIAESRVLQAVLTGEEIPTEAWSEVAAPIRAAIDDLGQEAVALGLLSPEAYERNRGTYVHRVYLRHETEANALVRWASAISGRARKKIVGNQFKGRGITQTATARMFVGAPVAPGAPVRALFKYRDPEPDNQFAKRRLERRVYVPADKPIPAEFKDFTDRGVFEVRSITKEGKATLWRDYTKDERRRMGEILDARYTIAKTFMTMAHDLSTGRFYRDIARNREWAVDEPPEGEGAMEAEDFQRIGKRYWRGGSVQWVRVPDTTIAKTGGTKRWGALAGKWVRAEIYVDLTELERQQGPGVWRAVLSQWKLNKTVRNPVTHMNNVVSNLVFMDLADVRVRDLARAIQSLATDDHFYRSAADAGAFGSDMIAQDMRRNVLDPILEEIQREHGTALEGALDVFDNGQSFRFIAKVLDRLWSGVKALDRGSQRLYQMEDEVFRLALYINRRKRGLTAEEAALDARDTFLNYDIRAPWVNAARNTVLPFISYTYRAVPVIARAALERPWKLAKWATASYALNALVYAMLFPDLDDDEREAVEADERGSMRADEQGGNWGSILGERMVRLPWFDDHGNPLFLDVRRWIPAGDVFETGAGSSAVPVPAPLQIGGPLQIAFELALNKQAFTGEPITNELTDTTGEKFGKTGSYLWKQFMPSGAYMPGSWHWEKIERAAKGGTDWQGRPYSVPQALAGAVGVKVKPQDIEGGYGWKMREAEETVADLRAQGRALQRELSRGLIDRSEFDQRMGVVRGKMEALGQRIRDQMAPRQAAQDLTRR